MNEENERDSIGLNANGDNIDFLAEDFKFESFMTKNFWYLPILLNFEKLNFEIIIQTKKNRKF